MVGDHNPGLVLLAISVAGIASYIALAFARRSSDQSPATRQTWITAAAIAAGTGIWAMHFIAMLALHVHGTVVRYDLGLTLASFVIAIVFTYIGFSATVYFGSSTRSSAIAGVLMGLGIASMHYVGVLAMKMDARVRLDPPLVVFSIGVAIAASIAAVWLMGRRPDGSSRIFAAALMTIAIAGMHFTGMAAMMIEIDHSDAANTMPNGLDQATLTGVLVVATTVLLLLGVAAGLAEKRYKMLELSAIRVRLRLAISDLLRVDHGESSLSQIAALIGEHFTVNRTGYGQLDAVEDMFDYDICWTDGSVPPLFGRYPASAFGVKIVKELSTGRTVAIDDLHNSPLSDEALTQETAREVDTRAILVVPFVRHGRLRTIVYLNDRRPRHWSADEVAFIEELAERTRLVVEREAVEQQLRDMNANLETRVAERTEELRQTQNALMQSQKMDAIGQLVAGISHDFNNLLGAVLGAFQLIKKRAEQVDQVRKLADAGLEAAERGGKLTAQLLAFSRAGNIQVRPIYVCDTVTNLHDMLARTLGPMVRLTLDLNPCPVPVLGDPTQLEMMILNLAINARDAMPDGGELIITTREVELGGGGDVPEGGYVELSVRDTGEGMDAETLNRALEPFFTTKPTGKGTGLGLAQVYGSAKQVGGTVRIKSTLGAGTTVSVYLPRSSEQPDSQSELLPEQLRAVSRKLSILLVDDDHAHRQILADGLETLGHTVSEAKNGREGLEQAHNAKPDVAILDYAMPGMTGANLAAELRNKFPSLPIVFVTGFSDWDAIAQAAGPNAVVVRKPFRMEEIERILSAL